jgi:hypothetical protein
MINMVKLNPSQVMYLLQVEVMVPFTDRGFSTPQRVSRKKTSLLKKIVKRGQGKSKHKLNNKKKSLIVVGNNVAGLKGGKDSLENLIETLKAGVIMLQETEH